MRLLRRPGVGYELFVVKAGSEGKELFRRPLRLTILLSRPCRSELRSKILHKYFCVPFVTRCAIDLADAGVR